MPAMETQYEPGKKLQCVCGRSFKTERGVNQHIKRAKRIPHAQTGHGRCWSATAKLMHKYLIKDLEASLNWYAQFRKNTK